MNSLNKFNNSFVHAKQVFMPNWSYEYTNIHEWTYLWVDLESSFVVLIASMLIEIKGNNDYNSFSDNSCLELKRNAWRHEVITVLATLQHLLKLPEKGKYLCESQYISNIFQILIARVAQSVER